MEKRSAILVLLMLAATALVARGEDTAHSVSGIGQGGSPSLGCYVADIDYEIVDAIDPKMGRSGAMITGVIVSSPLYDRLSLGDVVTSLANYKVFDGPGFRGTLRFIGMDGTADVHYFSDKNNCPSTYGTIAAKTTSYRGLLEAAIKPEDLAVGKLYRYQGSAQEVRERTSLEFQIFEIDGKLLPLLRLYTLDGGCQAVQRLVFSSRGGTCELDCHAASIQQVDQDFDADKVASIRLTAEQLDRLKIVLDDWKVTVKLGGIKPKEYRLDNAERVGLRATIDLYDLMSEHERQKENIRSGK